MCRPLSVRPAPGPRAVTFPQSRPHPGSGSAMRRSAGPRWRWAPVQPPAASSANVGFIPFGATLPYDPADDLADVTSISRFGSCHVVNTVFGAGWTGVAICSAATLVRRFAIPAMNHDVRRQAGIPDIRDESLRYQPVPAPIEASCRRLAGRRCTRHAGSQAAVDGAECAAFENVLPSIWVAARPHPSPTRLLRLTKA